MAITSSDEALTVGELRLALMGVPDSEPVMLLLDGGALSGWLRRARHDRDARTFDLLGGPGA